MFAPRRAFSSGGGRVIILHQIHKKFLGGLIQSSLPSSMSSSSFCVPSFSFTSSPPHTPRPREYGCPYLDVPGAYAPDRGGLPRSFDEPGSARSAQRLEKQPSHGGANGGRDHWLRLPEARHGTSRSHRARADRYSCCALTLVLSDAVAERFFNVLLKH